MKKILDVLGASVFWGIVIFIVVGSIAVIIKEGLIAVPHMAVGWIGIGFFVYVWCAAKKKPIKTLGEYKHE